MKKAITILFSLAIVGCSAGKPTPEPPMEPPAHGEVDEEWTLAEVGQTCGEEIDVRCVDSAYCQATPEGSICVLDERAERGEVCNAAAGTECKEGLVCDLDETINDGSGVCVEAN